MGAKRVLLGIGKSSIPEDFNEHFEWCKRTLCNNVAAKWIPADAKCGGL